VLNHLDNWRQCEFSSRCFCNAHTERAAPHSDLALDHLPKLKKVEAVRLLGIRIEIRLISNRVIAQYNGLVYPGLNCMPKRVKIEPHLSSDELERRYRQAQNVIERSHYQTIWLLALGNNPRSGRSDGLWTELDL